MELMMFHDRVKSSASAKLKEALIRLDAEEKSLKSEIHGLAKTIDPWEQESLQMWLESDLSLVQDMRKTIAEELRTRSKKPEDKARQLIDAVVHTSGPEQLEAYLKFAGQMKTCSDGMLVRLRAQLIDRMANEPDREQRLLYKLMLHEVNQEMDRRSRLPIAVPADKVPPLPVTLPVPLDAEEQRLLSAKLSAVGTGLQAAVKSRVGIKD